ncbi:nuclease domain-containing protein [Litorilituus lipolyticus]|uniref:DUF2357 domain-containing protein n=1 Tax=Litorilituus lipolyticus TaxID=2491017 RepID=A0A502KSX2_9GAMM|nr:nuclease domain-containing protein [Litorilituus lipolyticus]TPH13255.1 hypothetical protein EPA86_13760 [Litorilituus lipolyticus]
MTFRVVDIKSDQDIHFINNEFVIEENKKYKIIDEFASLKPEEFITIGEWLSPNLATLTSTNKVAVFRLKNIDIRVTSKLGDDFFNKIKSEIAAIEKQLLISSNGLSETLALSHGTFLEDVAISLLQKSWNNGKAHTSLRILFEAPRFGFFNKNIVKNLRKGDVLTDIDFQYLKSANSFVTHNGRATPATFTSVVRAQTSDVLEMRFIKFFLLFCFNLLERRISRFKSEALELNKKIDNLQTKEPVDTQKVLLLTQNLNVLNSKYAELKKIKLKVNVFLRKSVLKEVKFSGHLDFTSLKLHNNFHLKYLLNLYLNMRKSFEPISSDNLVYLDINSLENLYEYYCFIRLLRDFGVSSESIKNLITRDKSGWVIDKSLPIAIGNHSGFTFTLYFKMIFSGGKGSYSQNYDPDYTIVLTTIDGDETYLNLDAKYKHNKGKVKKEDIDKMHTYAHAIKKSVGSVVLFPGKSNTEYDCLDSKIGALYCNPNKQQNLKDSLLALFF